jgi:hypothetical protein
MVSYFIRFIFKPANAYVYRFDSYTVVRADALQGNQIGAAFWYVLVMIIDQSSGVSFSELTFALLI